MDCPLPQSPPEIIGTLFQEVIEQVQFAHPCPLTSGEVRKPYLVKDVVYGGIRIVILYFNYFGIIALKPCKSGISKHRRKHFVDKI